MGFLKEQSGNYAYHYASVHLSAIRYLLFSHMFMQDCDIHFGEHRKSMSDNLELMSFASLLWGLFKAIISGVLGQFQQLIGEDLLQKIKDQIDCTVNELLNQVLQVDPQLLLEENRAEAAGVLS